MIMVIVVVMVVIVTVRVSNLDDHLCTRHWYQRC